MKNACRVLSILALVLYCSFVRCQGQGQANSKATAVVENGRKASAKATAISKDGGNATANAKAKTDGQGDAKANVVSIADKDSTSDGKVTAESKDGGDASANLIAKAEDGATTNATAGAKAEGKDAVAIVDSIASAKGDLILESEAISEAINKGNGSLVSLVVERAFADSETLGDKVSKVIKVTIVKAISRSPENTEVYSATIANVLTSKPDDAARFSKILSSIIKEKSCKYLQPYLTTAQAKVAAAGTEEAMIIAIQRVKNVVRCTYPVCEKTEFCCSPKIVDVHMCQICPKGQTCAYVAHGKGVLSILKDATPDIEKKFCACPN